MFITLICATLPVDSSQLDSPQKQNFISQLPMEHLVDILNFNSTAPGISSPRQYGATGYDDREVQDFRNFSLVSRSWRQATHDFILATIVDEQELKLFKQVRKILYFKDQSKLIHYNVRSRETDPFCGCRGRTFDTYGNTYPLPTNPILLHCRKEADFLFTPWGTLAFLKKGTMLDRFNFLSNLTIGSYYTNTSIGTYNYKSKCDPNNISCPVISHVDTQPIQYNMNRIMGRTRVINCLAFDALQNKYYQEAELNKRKIKNIISPSDQSEEIILIPDLTEIVAEYAIEFDIN